MSTRDDFASLVRREPVEVATALTLLAAEVTGEVPVVEVLSTLDALAVASRPHLAAAPSPAEALRRALGDDGGFGGREGDHGDLRASLLPAVLQRQRGLPVLLSVVWTEVARRLEVPAHALAVPGQVLVWVDGEVVDPWSGGRLLPPVEAAAARAHGPLEPLPLLLRVLANVRALAARTSDTPTGLWACELSLLLPRHPLELRREHGTLLVRSGRFPEGAAELEEFASVAPDPLAATARGEARMARARLN